jgi:peptide/nickel transport system permease protein
MSVSREQLVRHTLPNVFAPVTVIWTLEVAPAILIESALSFVGLGVPPPTPTRGRLLAETRGYLSVTGWTAMFPGLAIMVTALGFNSVRDGRCDLPDTRLLKSM